jgi:hypothetical protein
MNGIWPLLLVALLQQSPGGGPAAADRLFDSGNTWPQFIAGVSAQRELWLKTEASVTVPPELVDRARKAGRGLRLLAVAEDWCPDSAYSLPYVARLAQSAGIPLRILDRTAGAPLMRAHPTPDGRTVTPTIVLWRDGRDVGAWIERPAELQQLFLSISTSPENAQRFSQRHVWYESDGGRTVLQEVLALIEQTSTRR